MTATAADPACGSLRRSVRLFRLFRQEQTDPELFYTALARDSVRQVQQFEPLAGHVVLDVGGGPGYFRRAFEEAGGRYVAVDTDVGELSAVGPPEPGTVLGSGMALPLRSDCVDVSFSSNVLEHVQQPWTMADEMVRVTRPGGLVVLSYTAWWGPWGGHETAPWHYLGGERAAARYRRRHGHGPKNEFGRTLFPVTVTDGLRWARSCRDARVLAAGPRYLPSWASGVVRVPGIREVATWNLLLVLRAT
jgi:SAM-dependent methyltransferase